MRSPLLNDSANLYRLELATNCYSLTDRQKSHGAYLTYTTGKNSDAVYQSISPHAIRVPGPAS